MFNFDQRRKRHSSPLKEIDHEDIVNASSTTLMLLMRAIMPELRRRCKDGAEELALDESYLDSRGISLRTYRSDSMRCQHELQLTKKALDETNERLAATIRQNRKLQEKLNEKVVSDAPTVDMTEVRNYQDAISEAMRQGNIAKVLAMEWGYDNPDASGTEALFYAIDRIYYQLKEVDQFIHTLRTTHYMQSKTERTEEDGRNQSNDCAENPG